MPRQTQIEMLERELHGIDVSLELERMFHIQTTDRINGLEAERAILVDRLDRLHTGEVDSW